MNKENKKDKIKRLQSLSERKPLTAFLVLMLLMIALLTLLVSSEPYVVFFAVMFGFIIIGPIMYFRKNGIKKGSFQFKKSNKKSFWNREI